LTSNGVGATYEYTQRRLGYTDYMPGRLFIYYEERRIIGTLGYDSGAFIRDGLRVVNKLGAPHESLWPYDISRFTSPPPQSAYDDGLKHLATAYMSVDNKREYDVKAAIAQGLPVVFGFTVFPWFESPDKDGFCRPVLGQSILGGHCVVCVGYFRLKNVWWAIIRNSWGISWGAGGYCFVPLRWICNYWNADDFWVIQDVEPDELSKLKAAADKRMRLLVNDSAPGQLAMQLSAPPHKCPNCGCDIAAVTFQFVEGATIELPFVIPAGQPIIVKAQPAKVVADGSCAPQTVFLYSTPAGMP
jgi:hypothetical protein